MLGAYQPCPMILRTTEKVLFVSALQLSASSGSCSWTTSFSPPRTPEAWIRTPPCLPLVSTTPLHCSHHHHHHQHDIRKKELNKQQF
ncbi:hypothetical protein CIPAW_06G078600 [Carya illinoinensis]|uniref:Uncharacterized protein n=1 Tax=Carya illinoinensis TaxID=32201 RepID=A0A8T1Q9E0_CARIL|nr:hypothetical protein CIPAW_06G078600 [Carya illinoinensis]